METAKMPETGSRPVPFAEVSTTTPDAPLTLGDKLIVIFFLVGVALFGIISLVDLLYGLCR